MPTRATRRDWAGLAVVALPCALYAMDLTVLDLALPAISADLRPSNVQLLWIADVYGFFIAGSLITMGTLGDRVGHRRMLLIGAAAFGAASAVAAFATTPETLIAARALLGVAACISPWNLPLYLFTWKIAPALATGNAVVAKPSEVTPCTAARLGELAIAAGFPRGVLNIVLGTGAGVGQPLVEHDSVKAISFTGSTRTGVAIAAATATRFRKVSLDFRARKVRFQLRKCAQTVQISTTPTRASRLTTDMQEACTR